MLQNQITPLCAALALVVGCGTTQYGSSRASTRSVPARKTPAWSPSAPSALASNRTNRPSVAPAVTNAPSQAHPARVESEETGSWWPFHGTSAKSAPAVSYKPAASAPIAVTNGLAKALVATDGTGSSHGGSVDGHSAKLFKPPAVPDKSVTGGVATATNALSTAVADVRLRAGLVVDVTVLVSGKKEIEEHAKRVSDSGTMTLPMLGSVLVKDKTLEELTLHLEMLYREYFVSPQVIVDFVRDENPEAVSPWGFATVLGRVKKPGRISLPATRDMTISGAIQQAGGFDTSAKDSAIRVTRRRDGTGAIETREVNLRAVGAIGKLEDDIAVQPDDVIFVPELVF